MTTKRHERVYSGRGLRDKLLNEEFKEHFPGAHTQIANGDRAFRSRFDPLAVEAAVILSDLWNGYTPDDPEFMSKLAVIYAKARERKNRTDRKCSRCGSVVAAKSFLQAW